MKSSTAPDIVSQLDRYTALHRMQDEAIQAAPGAFPSALSGEGIVMVAGGMRHFTNAYVSLFWLRQQVKCQLPIQVWHLGPAELSPLMKSLLSPLDVEFVDAMEVRKQHPMRILTGWECKAFALAWSPFRKVILIDADNIALIDPATLLELPEFRQTGALFWPDIQTLPPTSPIWEMCRVPYRKEPEFESGQIVLDKERSWTPLSLAVHLNAWSDIYYQQVLGDKETFHMAWRALNAPMAMPDRQPTRLMALHDTQAEPILAVRGLVQHDFEGRPIFHHRTNADWVLYGQNTLFGKPEIENRCLALLEGLRSAWDGRIEPDPPIPDHLDSRDLTGTRRYLYRRPGIDQREIEFEPDGIIGFGRGERESSWSIERDDYEELLVISGKGGVTCRLTLHEDKIWRGRWVKYEQSPVELIPVGVKPEHLLA